MITLGIRLQDTDEIPLEIAEWLVERNSKYPGVNFTVDRFEVRDVDKSYEESTGRKIRERYAKTYGQTGALTNAGPEDFGVGTVNFLYGQETWSVKITGGLNEKGEIKNLQTMEEGEQTKSLPLQLRNEIAGFDFGTLERLGNPAGRVGYAENRTDKTPFQERPEAFLKVEWDFRKTGLTFTSGKELAEALNDPEKRVALEQLLKAQREGNVN